MRNELENALIFLKRATDLIPNENAYVLMHLEEVRSQIEIALRSLTKIEGELK